MGVRVPPFAQIFLEEILEYKINVLNESTSEMEFSLAPDEIVDDIQTEINKQTKNIQIDGFRKGKAPKHVVKKLYGDSLEYEAAEKVSNKKFWSVVDEIKIKPLGEPVMTDFHYKPGEELKFKVKYEVYPEIELKQYKDIEVTVPKLIITDDDVENQLKELLASRATYEDADSIDGKEFQVTLDLQEMDQNNEPILGKDYKGLTVDLNRSTTNPQIVENSQAKKIADKFEFVFTDTHTHKKEDGTEEEHKEEKRYEATITKIQKQVFPPIDENFVQSITRGEYSEEAGLKKYIREILEFRNEENSERFLYSLLDTQLLKLNDFTPPNTLINYFYDKVLKEEKETRGKNFKPTKEFEDQLRVQTVEMFKLQLFREEIVRKENLTLSNEIIEQFLEEDSRMLKVPVEKLRSVAQSEEKQKEFQSRLYRKFLKDNNKITYKTDYTNPEKGN